MLSETTRSEEGIEDHAEPSSSAKIQRTDGSDDQETRHQQLREDPLGNTLGNNAYITRPGSRDILMGRGRGVQAANGNSLMREIAKKHHPHYLSLKRDQRRAYSEAVLDEVIGTGARFLRKVETGDEEVWEEVERVVAHDKISHALRDQKEPSSKKRKLDDVETESPQQQPQQQQQQVNPNTIIFQDPNTGLLFQVANGIPSVGQQPSATGNSIIPVLVPQTAVGTAASQTLGATPAIQNPLMQSFMVPTAPLVVPQGIPGLPMAAAGGTIPANNLPALLSSLAILVQQNPALGALIQQVLAPATTQVQQPAAAASNQTNIGVVPGLVHQAAQIPGLTPNGLNPLAFLQNPMGQLGNFQIGAPGQQHQPPTNIGDSASAGNTNGSIPTMTSQQRQGATLEDDHGSRLGVNMPASDTAPTVTHDKKGGQGNHENGPSSSVQGLPDTDYANAVMQALVAVRPPASRSVGGNNNNDPEA